MIEKVIKRLEYCTENKCDICQKENGSGFPWIDGRCYGFTERLYDALALLKAQEPIEAQLHLCDSCTKLYPECDATADGIEFGCGVGNDNIIGCTAYENRWKAQELITGETSDGYHTFNELYHHRAVLFSVIVANYKDLAWKSVRHHDGTMYDGMFIVGIDTPDGQATYHYDIDPYWDMFDCKVREFAPEWDGHTPAQAIERISKLKAQELRECENTDKARIFCCSICGYKVNDIFIDEQRFEYPSINFCPNCGTKINKEK